MTAPDLILPATRSGATAVASFAATALVLTLGVALMVDPAVTPAGKVAVGLLGGLFAGTLGLVGVTLLRGHGALLLDVPRARLGLGVTGQGDTWWLPLARVQGLAVGLEAGVSGAMSGRWLLILALEDHAEIVLAESDERGAILEIRDRLAARLGIALLGEDRLDGLGPYGQREISFAVARGAALTGLLAVFGASLAAFGVIALTEVLREPVIGFIFAPILVVMGVALIAVPLVKHFAHEALGFDGSRWTHAYAFSRWRWGERSVKATSPIFRLRLLGMRGGMLELIGEDGVLVIAAGATAHSRIDLASVASIPNRFKEL